MSLHSTIGVSCPRFGSASTAGVWLPGPKNRPRSLFDAGIFLLDKGAQGAYLEDSPQLSGHLQAASSSFLHPK